ncbi:hypothetical protein BDZ97DRAFT_1761764 [Flammula alnicola]|nr:hypothetical protein BDZ97DRAFT_1761764 [Flammula alnicola]
MSGKAPPKGPRALLGTQAGPSGPASSSSSLANAHSVAQQPPAHPQPPRAPQSALPPNPNSRIGATPPTGPRSLQANNHSRPPPPGPKHLLNGHSHHSSSGGPNGLGPHALQSNRHPISIKGKKRDIGPNVGTNHSWQSSHSQSHPWPESNVNGVSVASSSSAHKLSISPTSASTPNIRPGELKQDRPSVHIPMQPRLGRDRPATSTEQPPPPPPNYDPPPPPPPTQPPPPPPPPSTVPEPQPAPPPPPPSESCPPPPPPPASPPPPSPPPLPPASSPPPLPPSISPPPPPPPSEPSLPSPPPPAEQPPPPPSPPPPPPPPTEPPRSPSPVIVPPPPPKVPTHISLPPRPPSPPSWNPSPRSRESSSRYRPPEPVPAPEPPKKAPSLPPLPAWPPPRSEYANHRSFKVLYDPAVDSASASSSSSAYNSQTYPHTHSPAYYRQLIEHVRNHAGSAAVVQDRIRGKGKGKETLYRMEGEVIAAVGPDDGFKEDEPVVRDPRKVKSLKRPNLLRSGRNDFVVTKYQYDENSTGPPPPTSVLITNISPLTSNHALRRNFGQYGPLITFEPQIDKENGSALGVLFIKFQTHEEAKRCVERENGRKGGIAGLTMSVKQGEIEEWKVVFDGEGSRLKAVLKELDERKKREREEKRRGVVPNGIINATPGSSRDAAGTPYSGIQSPAPRKVAHPPTQPKAGAQRPTGLANSTVAANLPPKPSAEVVNQEDSKPIDALEKARADARERNRKASTKNGATARGRNGLQVKYGAYQASPMNISRSPSPSAVRNPAMNLGPKSAADREKERQEVVRELAQNGQDHVKVQGGVQLVASVKDDDVRAFFDGFVIDKILRDHTGLYVTFPKAGVAHRATTLLGTKQLGFQSVTLTVHPAPTYEPVIEKTHWDDAELVEEAQAIIVRELRTLLEKDISERLVGQDLKKLIIEMRHKGAGALQSEQKPLEKRGLKGLSFKKKVKEVIETEQEKEEPEEEEGDIERPKKKRKTEVVKKPRRVIDDEDIESEDEDEADIARVAAVNAEVAQKRAASEDRDEDEEPVKKKSKIQQVEVKAKKSQKKPKKGSRTQLVDEVILGVAESFESPAITQLRLDSTFESSLSPSRSPSPVVQPKRKKRVVTPPPTPPPDPVGVGLCEDDEDIYFAKLAISGEIPSEDKPSPPPSSSDIPTFRKHLTGSARTEGYYKITHAEKAAYVAQYQARAANAGSAPPIVDEPQPQHVISSRSNRANARRRAQGLEEINQVQRAVALSKGETAANELTFKFNQLQTRKKHLRFARSPIHDWGLYAMEKISRGEMVIEYVGEVIRAQVADKREKAYERQGIGSSYLFRIDEDLVVDATKKGNLGRLINHSCDPNCTAKIITISGEKKIVIYAKQDIELGDEITYDYHFPFEQDKIPCLCGSAKCRGFLN